MKKLLIFILVHYAHSLYFVIFQLATYIVNVDFYSKYEKEFHFIFLKVGCMNSTSK